MGTRELGNTAAKVCLQNIAIVILGASGDLAAKKLLPSLLELVRKGYLDLNCCKIIGNGRSALSLEEFCQRSGVMPEEQPAFHYYQGIDGLLAYVQSLGNFTHYVVFFSLPASVYVQRCRDLLREGFPRDKTRIVIEKPFGYNAASAMDLNRELLKCFPSKQIYLIDHYLGKETAQNIMVMRFANRMMESVWSREHVLAIEIRGLETIGIGSRGATYEQMGAIRDVVQNHLLQLLALSLMEPPASLEPEDIREAKHRLLQQVRYVRHYRYQYEGYRQEKDVAPDSDVETYAELELAVDNPRWEGVPIYLRGGKKLHRSGVDIVLHIKENQAGLYPNQQESIVLNVQPLPGLEIWQKAKKPGINTSKQLSFEDFSLQYNMKYRSTSEIFGAEAYTQLFYSILQGDSSLFVDIDEAVTAWKIVEPCLGKGELRLYKQNTMPKSELPSWQAHHKK